MDLPSVQQRQGRDRGNESSGERKSWSKSCSPFAFWLEVSQNLITLLMVRLDKYNGYYFIGGWEPVLFFTNNNVCFEIVYPNVRFHV